MKNHETIPVPKKWLLTLLEHVQTMQSQDLVINGDSKEHIDQVAFKQRAQFNRFVGFASSIEFILDLPITPRRGAK